jgi:glucosamine--fructose-6-phosphate aminotransferase (isomerizing)
LCFLLFVVQAIRVPGAGLLSGIVAVVPFQIIAYELSVLKGNNPDKPRNLAKSVTVD